MARTKKRKAERARAAGEQQRARLVANQPAVTVVCGSSQWMVKADWPPKLRDLIQNEILKVNEDEEICHEVMRFMQLSAYHAPEEDILLHMRVFCMADKYQVKSLVYLASNKFIEGLKLVWDTPVMADAIVEAYSNDATLKLRKQLWLAINQHIRQFRRCRGTYVDFWTAATAFPELQKDLESYKAKRAARLASRQEERSARKAEKVAWRAQKKAKGLAKKAANIGAHDGGADFTAFSGQNTADVAENGLDEPESEYDSGNEEGDDDDDSRLEAEDLADVQIENVVERRTRGRRVFYTSGGKAMNQEQYDEWIAKNPKRQKYHKVTTERARERDGMKY